MSAHEDRLKEVAQRAQKICGVISTLGNDTLKKALKESIRTTAELRTWRSYTPIMVSGGGSTIKSEGNDVYKCFDDGRPLRPNPRIDLTSGNPFDERLKSLLGANYKKELAEEGILLQDEGLLGIFRNDNNVSMFNINLRNITDDLPGSEVFAEFAFDPKKEAEKLGYDYAEFVAGLKKGFKGTFGTPGRPDFAVILDVGQLPKPRQEASFKARGAPPWFRVLGLLSHDDGPNTLILSNNGLIEQMMREPEKWQEARYQRARDLFQHAQAKRMDPYSMIYVGEADNPIPLQILAKELNFQGASHYLAKNLSR